MLFIVDSSPCRVGEACMYYELCRGGLAGSTIPDWSRVRGLTKNVPGPPGWGFGLGLITPP